MWIAVCPERSSCPCFAAALTGEPVSRSVGSWNFQGAIFPGKEKYRPRSTGEGICRVKQTAKWSGVLRGGKSFRDDPRRGSVQNEHDHILWMVSNQSTKSVRFVTENIMFRKVRQDDFEKFMTVKHKKSYYLAQIEVYLTFLLKRCPFYAAASVTAWR